MKPFADFTFGLTSFIAGIRWLGKHPAWLALLLVPFVIAAGTFSAGVWAFFEYSGNLYDFLLFARPADPWKLAAWYALKGAVGAAMFLFVLGVSVVVAAVLASPVFDRVSLAVERDILGASASPAAAPFFSVRMALDDRGIGRMRGQPLRLALQDRTAGVGQRRGIDREQHPIANRGVEIGHRIGVRRVAQTVRVNPGPVQPIVPRSVAVAIRIVTGRQAQGQDQN